MVNCTRFTVQPKTLILSWSLVLGARVLLCDIWLTIVSGLCRN